MIAETQNHKPLQVAIMYVPRLTSTDTILTTRLPDELESVNPVWGGTVVYRSLINAEKISEIFPEHTALSSPVMYTGDGKYCVGYPIDNGKFINIAVLATDYSKEGTRFDGPTVESADKEQILRVFDGWTDEFLELLKHIETTSKWTVQYLNVPSNFAVGRVALLGDAAHAMPPNLGSGAGQAIEDAYTLAHLLSKAVQDDIPIHRVTAVYTEARRPLANLVLERSRDMGRLVSFRALGYENIENADVETMKTLFERFASDFEGMFACSKAHPVEKEVEKALNIL